MTAYQKAVATFKSQYVESAALAARVAAFKRRRGKIFHWLYIGMSFSEIGRKLKISRQRVRQITLDRK